MATGITSTADLNGLFKVIYQDALFVAREQNIMTNLVTNFSASGWMARKFTKRPQIAAEAKAEGEDFAKPTKFGKEDAGSLIPGMVMAQSILTDEDMETDPESVRQQCARELGDAISTKIDQDLVGDFASFDARGPGAGSPATIAKFAACIAILRNRLVPNPIKIVCHPFHWYDVWTELGQPAAQKAFLGDLANQALRDFYVGDWLLAEWYVSANIAVDGNDDAISGVFNAQALAFDSRKVPDLETERDASRLAYELNMSAGYAHGACRRDLGLQYVADASEPS
jgi:hypothetical protein